MADAAAIERLLEEADALPDPRARETATALAAALLELYGDGLERVVAVVAEHDEDGTLAAALAGDELVGHLLLLHGLHPEPLAERVDRALDEVRPYLASHGGAVQLLGIEDDVVRVRLQGTCNGCPSSSVTLRHAIEDAVQRRAPDVQRVVAEPGEQEPAAPPLLQLDLGTLQCVPTTTPGG
jgi:Fe-S cluster biogenesis protein NfuA